MDVPNHLVFWKIRCLHRERKEFFDRLLMLDESRLTEEDRERFFAMIGCRSTEAQAFFEFRSCFIECDDETHDRLAPQAQRVTFGGPSEYFEDENCKPIDDIGIAQVLTGNPDPILRFEPRSVLRLGPSPIAKRDEWSVEKANPISHFLQLMNRIGQSGWLKSPLSIQYVGNSVVQVAHANAEMTTTALTYIRQLLLKRDDVLNHACEAYVEHISHDGRRFWVSDIHQSFNACLESDCRYGPQSILSGYTTRQVIDIFTYGSGLFHRESNHDCEAELANLIAQHGRERLIIAFNSACRDLIQYGFFIAPVMWQDVVHWVRSEGCLGPDRPQITDLFGE